MVDVLSLHVPGGHATEGLIDASIFKVMLPHAVVVNTARGSVIDEHALCDALESGAIAGAGLDVFANEPTPSARLLSAPHLTLLPHIGSATTATRRAMCELAASGVAAVLAGSRPPNMVTTPSA
jgi:lactate dehydrogenase-like 2-hydroxyacid dehydrogenase